MANMQKGVLTQSKLYFAAPVQNKDLFFYPVSTGHFYCEKGYKVERKHFDSILINWVIEGSFSFFFEGRELTARGGQIALIDCFHPHIYCTHDALESCWLHIGGANTYALYQELTSRFSPILPATEHTKECLLDIYSLIKDSRQLDASQMSLKLYTLLMELFQAGSAESSNSIADAIDYIGSRYQEKLTVEEVARHVHLSPSQFSRKFKRQTGTSPYDYILTVRLARAKELLKNTSLPISEIADETGFASDSNFIYFFKRQEGISPLRFRRMVY